MLFRSLRSEEYINLCDVIIGNVDTTNDISNISTAYILPSSYIGSPRHIQEYIQDAMTYVHAVDQIFLSHLSVIQTWDEIINLLLSGQTSMHCLEEFDYTSLGIW